MSSESETGAKGNLGGTNSYPEFVKSSHVERTKRGDPLLPKPTKNPKPNENEDHDLERRDPFCSEIPDWLQEFRENLADDRVPECRSSHASFSHELSLERTPTRSVDLGKHSVYIHFHENRNCEIVRGPKLKGPRAEDALAEPYIVQKIFLI